MENKKYRIKVSCKNCKKEWMKRKDSLKIWSGLCMSCMASNHLKGNHFTLGHKLSEEHKNKISLGSKHLKTNLGRKMSKEQKRKISEGVLIVVINHD